MIRQVLGGPLLAALLVAPVAAAEKADPKLAPEAKDGIRTSQENLTKMKLKKAPSPVVTGAPLTPSLPAPSMN